MIPNSVLDNRGIYYNRQQKPKLATALNNSLPPPNECQHKFSDGFEEKIQSLIKGIGTKCLTVATEDFMLYK